MASIPKQRVCRPLFWVRWRSRYIFGVPFALDGYSGDVSDLVRSTLRANCEFAADKGSYLLLANSHILNEGALLVHTKIRSVRKCF